MLKTELTQERLHSLLDYDPDSGVFRWKCSCDHGRRGRRSAGDVAGGWAGGRNSAYWMIGIDYRRYLAHRLAWFYVHGEWPPHQIDHIDLDKTNNTLVNLR